MNLKQLKSMFLTLFDLMVKARWVKQYGQSAKGLRVDWTDRGKLAMDALGYVIEDLGPESLNQQLWWAVGNACSRSHDAVIRVYDEAGNVIETHEHAGEFEEW
jgi:hypothetical protein